jgi:glycerophosphoryl diester phosphodiesterase
LTLGCGRADCGVRTALILLLTALFAQAQPIARTVIAHRGASGHLPEHTLEAVAMAHALGADYIEQDVVLSRDNVPVVLHDVHLDTVTDVATRFPERRRADGRWYALDFDLAELKQLRVTERFHAKTGKQVFPKRFPIWQSQFQIPTLEEELELIAGLNHSTGRVAGIYPEIKKPAWHRAQGHDPSPIVLAVLRKHGYEDKDDACFVQCFEHAEVRRLRHELGWQGRLIQLLGGGGKGEDGTDFQHLRTPAGLAELAKTVDGIGPAIASVLEGDTPAQRRLTTLVADAHRAGLRVHPYTVRADELPKGVASAEELMRVLFDEAGVDAVFSDFPGIR